MGHRPNDMRVCRGAKRRRQHPLISHLDDYCRRFQVSEALRVCVQETNTTSPSTIQKKRP
jgi:hypothetical protein